MKTTEQTRLEEVRTKQAPWKKWGPYLSERQWGTVREDYSEGGDAWSCFPHDHARSRAYQWGEEGLAGISDDKQRLRADVHRSPIRNRENTRGRTRKYGSTTIPKTLPSLAKAPKNGRRNSTLIWIQL